MNSRTQDTYMMFTKRGRGLGRVIGPFFYHQKEAIKESCFVKDKTTHLIEETAFATLYPQRYFEHIQKAWLDKMYCYFSCNPWTGQVKISVKDNYCQGPWFALFECVNANGYVYYQLNISVSANKFYAARLKQDLLEMEFMHLKLGTEYYEDKQGIIYKKHALSRYLADELCEHMCLS